MKNLRDYATKYNFTYRTAYNHFKAGLIPNSRKLPNGTIVIDEPINPQNSTGIGEEYVITYSRVSSSENKSNLIAQSDRLISFCNARGWVTKENICEIGSGLNDNRAKLNDLLLNKKPTKLVIEHKDKLTRFGFNYIKILCSHIGCEIIVINEHSNKKEDLIEDFVSVITSFCARMYGQRRCKRKTEKLIKELSND